MAPTSDLVDADFNIKAPLAPAAVLVPKSGSNAPRQSGRSGQSRYGWLSMGSASGSSTSEVRAGGSGSHATQLQHQRRDDRTGHSNGPSMMASDPAPQQKAALMGGVGGASRDAMRSALASHGTLLSSASCYPPPARANPLGITSLRVPKPTSGPHQVAPHGVPHGDPYSMAAMGGQITSMRQLQRNGSTDGGPRERRTEASSSAGVPK